MSPTLFIGYLSLCLDLGYRQRLYLKRRRLHETNLVAGNLKAGLNLLTVEPLCLQFHFELKKHLSCSLYLKNNSDSNVAFKVKVTDPSKYIVKPKSGVVPPRSTREVRVTMYAQKKEPSEVQIKEKFMIQSVLVDLGVTDKEVTDEMFYDGRWRQVEQTILRATYDFSSTSSCKCL